MYRKLSEKVFNIGAIDWDRRIFDQLVSIPHGTTYNAYLLKGSEKTAIVDTVDPTKKRILLDQLAEHSITKLDYIICNHAEQDHSGSIPDILEKFPEALVVTNEKCSQFLMDLLTIPKDRFRIVEEGESISLGNMTIRFFLTPWVHWPETMVSFYEEEGILFSCDFFGSHIATSDLVTDHPNRYLEGAKHYFAEIMMPFRSIVQKNLIKLAPLPIRMIAPSHGPTHKNPLPIMEAYRDWSSETTQNKIIIGYVSMHDSTRQMVEYVADGLMREGIEVKLYNLADSEIGDLAADLVDATSLILGSPTVLAGAHPTVIYAAFLVNALRPKLKYISVIGSFGWGGKMLEQIQNTIPMVKAEIIKPVLCKGTPLEVDYEKLNTLIKEFSEKHYQ